MITRVVKYDEEGHIIYDGPARRGSDQVDKKHALPFGLVPGDIIKVMTLIVAAIVFIVKSDERINKLEDATKYLTTFVKNSDGWHSATTGFQFEGGKPINYNYDISQLRKNEICH